MKLKITGGEVEVDDADAPLILGHSWYVNEHGYAVSRINGRLVRMHKLLTGTDRDQHIDHRDGNGLDNRRSKIRLASRSQNMWNSGKKNRGGKRTTTSKYKGVNLDSGKWGGWAAEVWKFGKKIFTKRFQTESDAAIAYDIVALREFGEFAKTNAVPCSEEDRDRVAKIVEAYKPRGKSKDATITFCKKWEKWYLFIKVADRRERKYVGGFASREDAEKHLNSIREQSTGGDSQQ